VVTADFTRIEGNYRREPFFAVAAAPDVLLCAMAKDDESPGATGDEKAAKQTANDGDLLELLLLRAGMALLPIFFRRVTLVEEPPRRRR